MSQKARQAEKVPGMREQSVAASDSPADARQDRLGLNSLPQPDSDRAVATDRGVMDGLQRRETTPAR